MGKIRLLDSGVSACIAAGEVVDRPATVAKELLENALDSGAGRIEAEIEEGGTARIAVADDGCGMDPADAALALERYATSKISSLAELEEIRTYGFRGEALAGIAAVSRLEILTRPPEALQGTRVAAEGGQIKKIEPAGAPGGTRVEVRDLFFNVPARRKFLKSVPAEEAACFDVLARTALSQPQAAFSAKKEGKIVWSLSRGETLKERYVKLFPSADENRLFSLESSRSGMRLSGLTGDPATAKSSRGSVLLYVNRRIVRPGVLIQAVLDGYSGYLQPGKFPAVVLFLEVDGKGVDVNVHPAKAEVRFSRPRDVYSLVEAAVAAKLKEMQENIRPAVYDFAFSQALPPQGKRRFPYADPQTRFEDLTLFEKLTPYAPATKENAAPVLLASIAKTYALFQENQTLFIVDLHVAHERINYDLLESRLRDGARPAQALLEPVVVFLSAPQQSLVRRYKDFLGKTGLELEEFGAGSVLIRSAPAGLEKFKEKEIFLSLLDKLEKLDEVKGPESPDRKILAALACRASVQAGDEVTPAEMRSIFGKLLLTSNPYFCPHGRPVIVKLSVEDLHRLFRRTWS